MTRRVFRIAIELIAALFAGIALLAGFVIWQLSEGPVSIDFLTEEIEAAINAGDSPIHVDVKDTVLSWGGWDQALDIVVRDVVLSDQNKRKIASLPEVAVELTISGLLRGTVAPTKVELSDPVLYARRTTEDKLQIFIPEKEDQAEILSPQSLNSNGVLDQNLGMDIEANLRGVVKTLTELENLDQSNLALRELKSILIVNGKLVLDDYINQRRWQLDQFLASLVRGQTKTILDVSGTVSSGEKSSDIEFSLFHPIARPELQFDLQLNEVDGETLIYALPLLEPFVENLPKSYLKIAGDVNLESETANLSGQLGTSAGKLNFGFDANVKADELIGVIDSDKLSTKILRSYGSALEQLNVIEADLEFDINLDMKISEQYVENINVELKAGEGTVHLPQFFPENLTFENLNLSSFIEDNGHKIKIPSVSIKIPEAVIKASATAVKKDLDSPSSVYDVNLYTVGSDFKMQYLDKYWPPSLGVDARNWVVGNIPVGDVPEVSMTLDAEIDAVSGDFSLIDVSGDIELENADVYYLRPLPKSVRSNGHARFGPDWFEIDVKSGNVGGIRAENGNIKFTELGTRDRAQIELPVRGPIDQGLVMLDMEPLKLISKLGLPEVEIDGIADGVLAFDFDLSRKLSIEDVAVDVSAKLTSLSIGGVIPDVMLTSNEMSLTLSQDNMMIEGGITSGKYKAHTSWFESFVDTEELQRKLDVTGNLDGDFLADKGVDVSSYATGGFIYKATLEELSNGRDNIIATLDLSNMELNLSDLNWTKSITVPAQLDFNVTLEQNEDVMIDKFALLSNGFDLALSGAIESETFDPIKIDVQRFKKDGSDLIAQINWAENGDIDIKATGSKFDATGIYDRLTSKEVSNDGQESNGTVIPQEVRVQVKIDEVTALPAKKLNDLNLTAIHTGDKLSRLSMTSMLANGHPLTVSYDVIPNAANQNLEISTSDFGQALENLELFENMEGGQLSISAEIDKETDALVGTVDVGPYRLTKAPVIGRVLEAISITGLPSALAGSELDFNTLVGGFRLDSNKFNLEKIKTYNRSVGLMLDVEYDLDTDKVLGQGTAVPAYGLNQAVGSIPILGWLLTGGDGGGLFGAKFYVNGDSEDPDVTVNPVSLLTPGALRRIFDLSPNSDGKTIMRSRKEIEESPIPKKQPEPSAPE